MHPPILHRMRSILTMKGDAHATERTLRAEHLEARFALAFGAGIMGEWVGNLSSDDASSPAEDLASLIENTESLTPDLDNPDLASTTDIEPMILGTEYGSTVEIDTRFVIDEYTIHRGDFLDGVIPLSDIRKESVRGRAVPFAWTIPQAWVDLNRPAEISIQRRDEVDVAVVRWMATQDHFLTAAASEATVQDVDASGRTIHQISTIAWRLHSSGDTESDHSSTGSSVSWNLHLNELSSGLIGLYVTGPFAAEDQAVETTAPPGLRDHPGGEGDPWLAPQIASPGSLVSTRSVASDGQVVLNGQSFKTIDVGASRGQTPTPAQLDHRDSATHRSQGPLDTQSTPSGNAVSSRTKSLKDVFVRAEADRSASRRWIPSSESLTDSSPFWAVGHRAVQSKRGSKENPATSVSSAPTQQSTDTLNAGYVAEAENSTKGEPSFVTTAMAWKSSESNEAAHELSPSDIVRTAAYLEVVSAKAEDRKDGLDAPGLCETLAAIDDVILRHADSLVTAATALALSTQVWLLCTQRDQARARDQKPPGALNSE